MGTGGDQRARQRGQSAGDDFGDFRQVQHREYDKRESVVADLPRCRAGPIVQKALGGLREARLWGRRGPRGNGSRLSLAAMLPQSLYTREFGVVALILV